MNNAFQITTAYRIDQLEKRLASLESSLSLLGQRVTSLDKVTDRLVKQEPVNLKAERPKIEIAPDLLNRSRKKAKVAERYGVWRGLSLAGFSPKEIAEAFQCDDGSVHHAMRNGFKSGWYQRAESDMVRA